jgi:ankyrin repeat protein
MPKVVSPENFGKSVTDFKNLKQLNAFINTFMKQDNVCTYAEFEKAMWRADDFKKLLTLNYLELYLNKKDGQGCTLLYRACCKGNEKVVEWLLNEKADPNIQMISGRTALHAAVTNGYSTLVTRLLEAGADPFQRDKSMGNALPLHLVGTALNSWPNMIEHWKKIIMAFINAGVDLNACDDEGNSLLLARCTERYSYLHIPLIKFLLEQGANPNLVNKKGLSCLKGALIFNNEELLALLKQFGAVEAPLIILIEKTPQTISSSTPPPQKEKVPTTTKTSFFEPKPQPEEKPKSPEVSTSICNIA